MALTRRHPGRIGDGALAQGVQRVWGLEFRGLGPRGRPLKKGISCGC